MPAREKQHLFDYLDFPSYQILSALKTGAKTFTELASACSLSKSNFNDRLDWFVKNGFIEEALAKTRKGRSRKVYVITPTGKRILELLEEIERVYREGVSEEEKFEREAEEYLYRENKDQK